MHTSNSLLMKELQAQDYWATQEMLEFNIMDNLMENKIKVLYYIVYSLGPIESVAFDF